MDGRLIVIAVLVGIVAFLGSALFQLSRRERGADHSQRMVRALTWRVGLSVALFLTLLVLWRLGIIQPHAGP